MPLAVAWGRQCLRRVSQTLASQSPRQWHPTPLSRRSGGVRSRSGSRQTFAGWPRHRFGCLGDAGTRGIESRASPPQPLVALQPRRSKQRLGHPAVFPMPPIPRRPVSRAPDAGFRFRSCCRSADRPTKPGGRGGRRWRVIAGCRGTAVGNSSSRTWRPLVSAARGGPGCRFGLPGRRSRKRFLYQVIYHFTPLVAKPPR